MSIPVTPGIGVSVATDVVGSEHLQVMKLAHGATGSATQVSSASPLPVVNKSSGIGELQAVPSGGVNGTPIGTPPAGTSGVRLYLPTGSSVTFAVAASQPTAPPLTFTVSASTTGPNWDESLNGVNLYIVTISGSPLFRWY